MEFTDEQLTEIYKVANNEVGKARPLTTKSVFSAMRAIAQLVEQETLERAEKVCEDYANFEATTMDALFAANHIASKIYKLKDSPKV